MTPPPTTSATGVGTGTPANAGTPTKTAATPARASTPAGATGKEENQAWKTKERAEPVTGQNGTEGGYTKKPKDTPTNISKQSEPGREEPTSADRETKKASRNPTLHKHRRPHSPQVGNRTGATCAINHIEVTANTKSKTGARYAKAST